MNTIRFLGFLISFMWISNCLVAQTDDSNAEYKKELANLLEMDQEHRENSDSQLQVQSDSLARKTLDELYDRFGFPSIEKVEKPGLMTAILVLHHSEDCEWNRKWIRIFLDHYEDVVNFKILFSYMFERTYGSEVGICKASEFVANLKAEYSAEIITEFGIDKL